MPHSTKKFILISAVFNLLLNTAIAETKNSMLLGGVLVTSRAHENPVGSGVSISDDTGLNTQSVKDMLAGYIGQPITETLMQTIVQQLNASLAVSGRQFVVATLPEQTLEDGRVRFLVIQATVGEVIIKNIGVNVFTEDTLRPLLRVKPGDVLTQDALDEDVEWINRSNPYRNAKIITEPGKAFGQTDVSLVVTGRKPYSFSLGYDNFGTKNTERDRVTFSAGWGNVFGTDQQVTYALNGNPDFNRFQSHSLTYVIPLSWRHILSLTGNISKINSNLPQPFDSQGRNSSLNLRYDAQLNRLHNYTHGLNVGFDYKRADNNLLFSQTPVSSTLTKIYQFNIGYSGTLKDDWGQTTGSLNWVYSPGGYGKENDDSAFSTARLQAQSDYQYQTLFIQRTTFLPYNWAWLISARMQRSNANLLGSEQLVGGGVQSVRGFAEAYAFGDEGSVIRTELQSPFWEIGSGNTTSRVQGVVFYDSARLNSVYRLPGEAANKRLSAWGVGVRADFPNQFSLRVDAGKKLVAEVQGVATQSIIHLSLNKSF
jgi:hemolysin activation/secretion protein